eukprot:TRINITY_DN1692_c1_g1_i4.p1 TRINITY_DN1692_c1_g1~~TRINITY_DN1692_c1_g1_i4.p1  ORF type:complete len:666 (-),score=45.15 TRINITY_DN1692_c1_g1_i4:184-2133(-)
MSSENKNEIDNPILNQESNNLTNQKYGMVDINHDQQLNVQDPTFSNQSNHTYNDKQNQNEKEELLLPKIDEKVNQVLSDNVLLANVIDRLQQLDIRELQIKLNATQQNMLKKLSKNIINNKEIAASQNLTSTQHESEVEKSQRKLILEGGKLVVYSVEGKRFYVPERLLDTVKNSVLWKLTFGQETQKTEQGEIVIPIIKSSQFQLILDFLTYNSCQLPENDAQMILELLNAAKLLGLDSLYDYIQSHEGGIVQIRQAKDFIYHHPIIQSIINNFRKLLFSPDVFPAKWAFEQIEDDRQQPHWYVHIILSYYDGYRINPVWFTKEWERFNKRQTMDYNSEEGSVLSRKSQASRTKSERLKRKPQSEYSVYFNENEFPSETTFGFLITSEQLDMVKIYNYHSRLNFNKEHLEEQLSEQDTEITKNQAINHWLFNFFIRFVRQVQQQSLYRNIRIPIPRDLDYNNINEALSRALRLRLQNELGVQLFIHHIPYQDPDQPARTLPYFTQSIGEGKPVVHEFSVKLVFMVPTDKLMKCKPISSIGLSQTLQNLASLEQESYQQQQKLLPAASTIDPTSQPNSARLLDSSRLVGMEKEKEVSITNKTIEFPNAGRIQATSFMDALKLRREKIRLQQDSVVNDIQRELSFSFNVQ